MVRFELSTNASGASLGAVTATTNANGIASVSYTAGSTGTDIITVTALSNGFSNTVNINVDVGSGGTGTPETALVTVSKSQIFVAGVGQSESAGITIDIVDGAGNKIDDSAYVAENLRLSFKTSPGGGEVLGGNDISGVSVLPAASVEIATSSGSASVNLQSGTISGVVEILIEVFNGTDLLPGSKLFETNVSQIVIASGPAHAINLTSPNTSAVEDLAGGVYKRIGKAVVTDRYGNSVPDGTVINLGIIDTVIAGDDDGKLDGVTTPDLTQLFDDGTGTNGPGSFTTDTVIRNGVNRFIEVNDRVLVLDANAEDKSRIVASVPTLAGSVLVQKGYVSIDQTTNSGSVVDTTGLNYVIGAATLGGQIQGVRYNDDDTTTEVTGVAETKAGVATFYVTYPADEQHILIGCGIRGNACDTLNANLVFPQTLAGCTAAAGNWVAYRDERYTPTSSAEVYTVASASESTTDSAVTIDQGQFCFTSIAGYTLEAVPSALSGSGRVTITVRDGGDQVYLPFVTVGASSVVTTQGTGCFSDATNAFLVDVAKTACAGAPGTWRKSDFGVDLTDAGCITDNPGVFAAGDGVSGTCSGYVTITGTYIAPGDAATLTWWTAGDGEVAVNLAIP